MRLSVIAFFLSSGSLATAHITAWLAGSQGLDNVACSNVTLTVPVQSTNINFTGVDQTYNNQSYATQQLVELITGATNWTEKHAGGTFNFSHPGYTITGYLCKPKTGAKAGSAIQLLVHGIGFDSSYWDFSYAQQYSYVRFAASHGYTTFRYDRIGTGGSSKPTNGFNEAQGPTEVAILAHIASTLRTTTTIGGQKWAKIVGIGHSYGAAQTEAVSALYPSAYDAVILQGFSAAPSPSLYLAGGAYSIAADTLPATLSSRPRVWLVTGSIAAAQTPFFLFPYYEQGAFDLARKTEQPVTLGAFASIASIIQPTNFTGPVLIITGDKDYIFCGSDCYAGPNGTTLVDFTLGALYPHSSKPVGIIPANTGHANNVHLSAPAQYGQMINFISSNGL